MRHLSPLISGAGWIIRCRQTGRKIKGSLVERSASAGSYRVEMLGMIEIHVFLLAVEEFYKEGGGKNRVACDNKGALFTFAKNGQTSTSGGKQRRRSKGPPGGKKKK